LEIGVSASVSGNERGLLPASHFATDGKMGATGGDRCSVRTDYNLDAFLAFFEVGTIQVSTFFCPAPISGAEFERERKLVLD